MVWNHDSFRSPGSDDINLGFIKDFWDILNVELMHSYDDFQRNDKLTKWINNTFVALISKVDNPLRLVDFRLILGGVFVQNSVKSVG